MQLYSSHFAYEVDEHTIAIYDSGRTDCLSVEEDLDNVLARIAGTGIDVSKYHVILCNAEDQTWVAVAIRGGKSAGLTDLGVTSLFEAMAELWSMRIGQ